MVADTARLSAFECGTFVGWARATLAVDLSRLSEGVDSKLKDVGVALTYRERRDAAGES